MRLFQLILICFKKEYHVIFIGFDFFLINYLSIILINYLQSYVNYYKRSLYSFLPNIRTSWKNISFDGKKINKSNFHKNKKLFNIYDVDVDKRLISKREHYGKKKLI